MVSNKLDPELSADAQRIIAEARGFDDPTSDDRSRVKTRWMATVAAAAGLSAFGEAARAATGTSWVLKGAGLALALATSAAGLYLVWTGARQPTSGAVIEVAAQATPGEVTSVELPKTAAQPMVQPAAVEGSRLEEGARASAEPPSEVTREEAPVEEVKKEPPVLDAPAAHPVSVGHNLAIRPDPTPRSAPSAPKAELVVAPAHETDLAGNPHEERVQVAANGQLSEELGLISRIRGSVRAGAGAQALALLVEYQGRFERPIMGMEAAALRVDALCQTGQREAAHAAAEVFQSNWPGSPLEQRVSAACP